MACGRCSCRPISGHCSRWGLSSSGPTGSWQIKDFDAVERYLDNHGSFFLTHGGSEPPGLDILRTHVDKGHAMLFNSLDKAEEYLQGKVFSAPLAMSPRPDPMGP